MGVVVDALVVELLASPENAGGGEEGSVAIVAHSDGSDSLLMTTEAGVGGAVADDDMKEEEEEEGSASLLFENVELTMSIFGGVTLSNLTPVSPCAFDMSGQDQDGADDYRIDWSHREAAHPTTHGTTPLSQNVLSLFDGCEWFSSWPAGQRGEEETTQEAIMVRRRLDEAHGEDSQRMAAPTPLFFTGHAEGGAVDMRGYRLRDFGSPIPLQPSECQTSSSTPVAPRCPSSLPAAVATPTCATAAMLQHVVRISAKGSPLPSSAGTPSFPFSMSSAPSALRNRKVVADGSPFSTTRPPSDGDDAFLLLPVSWSATEEEGGLSSGCSAVHHPVTSSSLFVDDDVVMWTASPVMMMDRSS